MFLYTGRERGETSYILKEKKKKNDSKIGYARRLGVAKKGKKETLQSAIGNCSNLNI